MKATPYTGDYTHIQTQIQLQIQLNADRDTKTGPSADGIIDLMKAIYAQCSWGTWGQY